MVYATRVLMIPSDFDDKWYHQLARGVAKNQPPKRPPRFHEPQAAALVSQALQMRHESSAGLFAVAHTYMARVSKELIPLQRDGRANLPRGILR